jgi:hypothetical protein
MNINVSRRARWKEYIESKDIDANNTVSMFEYVCACETYLCVYVR